MDTIKLIPSTQPISGEITLAGSKSYSNRALIAAALSSQESTLKNISDSDDTSLLIRALTELGVSIQESGSDVLVSGNVENISNKNCKIDVGPAGTTMRFLLSYAALRKEGEVTISGSKRMHERPIGVLVDALRALGARITYLEKEGYPPLLVKGNGGLKGGEIEIDASISSQYITSLLLISPVIDGGLTLRWKGDLISKSYVDMTCSLLESFGIDVECNAHSLIVHPEQDYKATDYIIEGDASGGSYFWGLAALTQGIVTVKNISLLSAQGDAQFPKLLEEMGCELQSGVNEITIKGGVRLKAIRVNMELMPDTAQTLAVIASFAEGSTDIDGLSTLKIKETDRLVALHQELLRVGIQTEITDSSIVIEGGTPQGAVIETYHDHRMAMAFALFGAKIPGVEILDPKVVEKSFPTYWKKLESFGVGIE